MVFCVNLLDAAESDTRPREELDFGKFGSVTATTMRRASLEMLALDRGHSDWPCSCSNGGITIGGRREELAIGDWRLAI